MMRVSRPVIDKSWGPSHQHMEPPFKHRHPVADLAGLFFGVLLVLFFLGLARMMLRSVSAGLIGWTIAAITVLTVLRVLLGFVGSALTRLLRRSSPAVLPVPPARSPASLGVRVRERAAGAGAYLGVGATGSWAMADPQSAVMVLGPPRSGKTSAVMIPALMASCGPVVSTSTKPDVMRATMRTRKELGEVWLFDPSGTEPLPDGVRRLSWSPVTAAATWDGALVMARAMTDASRAGAGTTNENHWSERAAALLAPLLYAANLTGRPVEEVLRWTLRQDLTPALEALADAGSAIAADVLVGVQRTDARERSSIFSATAGVLSAYNADGARHSAKSPNFDPEHFAASTDTLYITSPEQHQAAGAPLIVGLLEQIRHATYARARAEHAPTTGMLWLLDEVANIAPIHDLPALASQAGGQSLQIVIGLQDLSQVRVRWGDAVADSFLSLFQEKVILSGIGDPRTLEAISLMLGEYDRDTITHSLGHSEPQEWFGATPTHSDTVSYQTQRQRVLAPGEIARLPDGHALHLSGADWQTIRLTNWFEHEPWRTIAQESINEQITEHQAQPPRTELPPPRQPTRSPDPRHLRPRPPTLRRAPTARDPRRRSRRTRDGRPGRPRVR
jgi:type IV secretion system protein VirD4